MEIQTEARGSNAYSKKRTGIALCLLILVSGGLYLNSLNNQFTNWDDGMIYGNQAIRNLNLENIQRIFTPQRASTYQPVRVLSYAVDYRFWKLDPRGYHITNVLLYILTCIMAFFTLKLLSVQLRPGEGPDSHFRVALFGGLFFSTLPVHVESVAWLSSRKEVLQGFFFFMAFYLYLRGRQEKQEKKIVFLVLVLVSILLAVLSKPSAVVFPAVLLAYECLLMPRGWIIFLRRHWLFFLISVFISLTFAWIVIKVMFDAGGIKLYRGGTFINNLPVSFELFLHNIKLLFFTINYSAAYAVNLSEEVLGLPTLIAIGICILLFGFSIWSLKKTKVIIFSAVFFALTLLPYLNILPISTLLADRYLFIPSFSGCLLLGVLFDKVYRIRRTPFSEGFFKLLSVSIFLFLLGGYSFMTIQQNRIWENSYTLWMDAVTKSPGSNTANALMGVVYMDLGMDEEAVKHLLKAVEIFPYDYMSRNNLGLVYARMGDVEKGLKELFAGLSYKPDDYAIRINISVFYERQEEYGKAIRVLEKLISENPRDANVYYRLGRIYKVLGDYEGAISAFTKSMELAPDIINPYEEIGSIYLHHFKDVEKAKYYFTQGVESASQATSRVDMLRWVIQDLECPVNNR
jgi:tetratricopeptide (TPR) repeat protein